MTEGVELRFWAAVHSIETGEERRLATFYLMNTSLNRARAKDVQYKQETNSSYLWYFFKV